MVNYTVIILRLYVWFPKDHWSTSDIADVTLICYGFVAKIPQWKDKNNVWQHRNNQGPLRVTISHLTTK